MEIAFYRKIKVPIIYHVFVHSSFTKNGDSNPKTIYQFHRNVPSFHFNFSNANTEKYMTIVDHGKHIRVTDSNMEVYLPV